MRIQIEELSNNVGHCQPLSTFLQNIAELATSIKEVSEGVQPALKKKTDLVSAMHIYYCA